MALIMVLVRLELDASGLVFPTLDASNLHVSFEGPGIRSFAIVPVANNL